MITIENIKQAITELDKFPAYNAHTQIFACDKLIQSFKKIPVTELMPFGGYGIPVIKSHLLPTKGENGKTILGYCVSSAGTITHLFTD